VFRARAAPATGPLGKTSLFAEPPKGDFMMRKDLEKKVDPAKIKQEMHYG
jgi:hypothetical protein